MTDEDFVGNIFGWVGTGISLFFYIAPVVPFLKLIKGEITCKESPGILLICSFMNCILWGDYGLLLDRFLIYFANGIGGTITLIWIVIFIIHYVEKRFAMALLYNLILTIAIVGIALLFFFIVPYQVTGKIAMVFNVLMYASPGEKMITVFRTGNYKLIPIWSTLGGIACSACWMIYGIYLMDWNQIIPNGLGVLFSIFQVIVFLFYKLKNGNEVKEADSSEA
jgi:solute carrier family 50 protein (sugar transporter)